jgi:hypothetical protein
VVLFDQKALDRFRLLTPKEAFWEVKSSIYRTGAAASEDFQDAFDELVDAGVLSWDQIEEFERG